MAILVAQPHVWTSVGTGPLRIFPRSWRLGLTISTVPPAPDDPAIEIVQADVGQEFHVSLPIYVKPLDEVGVVVGVSEIASASGRTMDPAGAGVIDQGSGSSLMPINLIPPEISGSPTVGGVLAIDLGRWTNSPTSYMYQILRDGAPIAGAGGIVSVPGVSYIVDSRDVGTILMVSAAASNEYGVGGPITSAGFRIS